MNCCKCNRTMSEVKGMIPIEPKGTPNRKWVCTDCANIVQKQTIDKDTRNLCNTIAGEKIF
ncbi:hypothetical protein I5677_12190 [Mobilitalea sibirica]|uniref:Uncharacterized protein n=1 Tax=Mobilitalea sibirica TaxID=1462919 RepID=A0A8J7H3H2_9FIRM|nr:hypothetical protein [Mobilitalea sibirica]MBH1941653.1 hypothetical protein [Mobilitalea sibirica]